MLKPIQLISLIINGKIKGEDGEKGIVANLTNDTHIVPIEPDGTLERFF